jgi:DNA-binding NarL/FixJ family response regulator
MMEEERDDRPGPVADTLDPNQTAAANLNTLSQREMEVADLVSAGYTNQQIASRLRLSHKTIETYLGRIFRKLDICSRAQVARLVGLAGGIESVAGIAGGRGTNGRSRPRRAGAT